MTYQHDATRIHCDDLDREIELIRQERLVTTPPSTGFVERARRRTGHALMAAGRAVAGPDPRPLKAFEA